MENPIKASDKSKDCNETTEGIVKKESIENIIVVRGWYFTTVDIEKICRHAKIPASTDSISKVKTLSGGLVGPSSTHEYGSSYVTRWDSDKKLKRVTRVEPLKYYTFVDLLCISFLLSLKRGKLNVDTSTLISYIPRLRTSFEHLKDSIPYLGTKPIEGSTFLFSVEHAVVIVDLATHVIRIADALMTYQNKDKVKVGKYIYDKR